MSSYDDRLINYYDDKGICNANSEVMSLLDERIDTVYTLNAYLLSSVEGDNNNIMYSYY